MNGKYGGADDGFGPVVDAFKANFDAGAELGAAACAVYHRGRLVVDVHAGVTTGAPWTTGALAEGFSVTI